MTGDQVSVERDALIEVLRFTEGCDTDNAVTDAELVLRQRLMGTDPVRRQRVPRVVGMTLALVCSASVFVILGVIWFLAVMV